ncbi:putative Ig domain-containing protein [Spirosoma gilvum]
MEKPIRTLVRRHTQQFFTRLLVIAFLPAFPVLAQYTPGNVVVLQAGNGSGTLVNTGNPIVLREFSPAGTASTTVTVSSSGSDPLIISGSAASEGLLTRSANGSLLVFGGYAQALPNATQLAGASAATINRGIGTVNAAGTFSRVATSSSFYSANNIRGAASDGAANYWSAGGNDGTDYFGTGTAATVQNAKVNTRAVAIFTGKLYFSTQSGAGSPTTLGIYQVGTGLPTESGQTITNTINTGTGSQATGFFFNAAGTICYIADGRTISNGGGIQKWIVDGSTWSLAYTFGTGSGSTTGTFGLTVDFSGTDPVIYATTTESTANRLIKVTDTGAGAVVSTIATAPANTSFRGVAMAPVTPQPDLTIALTAPASATLNQPFNYSLIVSNQGFADAAGITAQFTLPLSASATYNSAIGANGFTASQSGDLVTFSGGSLAAGSSTTLTVTITPTVSGNLTSGTALVDPTHSITESNETNNSAVAVITMIGSGNQPPTLPSLTNQTGIAAVPFSVTAPAFTDPENESLTYMITGLPAGLSADNVSRVISGTPTTTGVSTVTVVATDPASLSTSGTFTITINANQPPTAPVIADQIATVNTAFSFTVPAFTDPENQQITYLITGLSNGLSADNTTRIISGTPTATGVQSVTVVATDPASNSVSTTFSLSVNAAPVGIIRITEYAYNGAGTANEFIELTNIGTAPIDLTGWSFDDNTRVAGSFSIGAFGLVQPGESVVIAEASAAAFRTAWYLPATVKVIGSNNQNLGNGDEINIYDATNTLVDRLTYPSSSAGGSTVFTNGFSAWTNQENLGTNSITSWRLSVINDAQHSYASADGNVGNPGGYFSPINRVLVRISGTTTTVAEGGASDTYTVALASQPTADVLVTITPGSQLTTNVTTLTFTPANFSLTQTVTISAIDDNVVEGVHSATITHAATSTDPAYNGLVVNPVSVTITDNDVAVGVPPTIVVAATTTAYLNGSAISGVIDDPTDPARTLGIDFTLDDPDTPVASLTLTASSNNASVVSNANLALTGSGASRNLKITPTGVGYATIMATVSDGSSIASYTISYAASAASTASSRFHTGTSDASTAQAIDATYMLVGDDDNQVLRLYNRHNSGLPIAGFDYTTSLGLTDLSGGIPRQVNIEASVRIGNRIYWLGSHNNASSGAARPNRNRLFATDMSGSGASTVLSYVGRYDGLKTDLINWDLNNIHGLGANYFGLQASAADGVDPEAAGGVGFGLEGLTVAPDGTTGYLAFRAPIEPTSNRTKALIIPVTNFTSLVSDNPTAGPATFGAPILLDLGGRGIREIKGNGNGQYLIVAGPSGNAGADPNAFKLFTWTGNPADPARQCSADLSGLSGGGGSSIESIVELPATLDATSSIQFLMDNGNQVYYSDGTAAKDLAQANFKKFRSDFATLGSIQAPDLSPTVLLPQSNFGITSPDNARDFVVNVFESGGLPTSSGSVVITITVPVGYSVSFNTALTSINVTEGTSNPVAVDNPKWHVISNVANQQISLTMNTGQVIAANATTALGFTITRTTANSGSVSNITVNVSDDATQTYDGNPANNVYARIISGL